MGLIFHERVGLEGRRISPFSWRIRYALAHKGLDPEVIPTRFADVARIRGLSGQDFVPIIEHDGQVVHDSWAIACHLEDRFPGRPSLFGVPMGTHWQPTRRACRAHAGARCRNDRSRNERDAGVAVADGGAVRWTGRSLSRLSDGPRLAGRARNVAGQIIEIAVVGAALMGHPYCPGRTPALPSCA
jgi:glutathione S-transferase